MTGNRALFLGIDGGGSGCRGRVVDAAGNVLGCGNSGPANLRLGVTAAWASLMTAATAALKEAEFDRFGDVVHAGIGLAGVSRRSARDKLMRQPHAFATLALESDAAVSCLGAHGGRDGGVIICGTGSIGFGYHVGRQVRIGGYGFPVSDEGGGAHLGLEALRIALRAYDGRVANSPFTSELLVQFGGDPVGVIEWMDRASPADYASLAPVVARYAVQGDPSAVMVMRETAAHLGEIAEALLARGVPKLAMMGGFAPAIEPWLSESLQQRLVPAASDAVDGAIILARRAAGA